MDYTPWHVFNVIYKKHGTEIVETDYHEWVIKRVTDSRRIRKEIKIILGLMSDAPRHCISIPPHITRFYDYGDAGGWYAMKRYTDEVSCNTFCKDNWKTLAIHVLQFLQDLHHSHRKVHMDIKKGNILYDETTCEFVVSDYELIQGVSTVHALDLDNDHKWYYLAMGAELTEPVYSWHMDLVALGYILGSLTAPTWDFEQECYNHRTVSGGMMNVTEMLDLRSVELATVDPLVTAYLALLKPIAWTAWDPPPRSFYEELEALFRDHTPPS